jgi:predicted HicB family RNase H-like nuclease
MEASMKRIVDGLTYNTDTSTLLARAEWEPNQWSPYSGAECEGELYQTRGGAFFLVTTIHIPEDRERGLEPRDKVEFAAMTAERAQAWMLEGDVEVYRNPFEEPPEAEAEPEGGATIYIRVPAALKRDVDEAAQEAKVSVNVWAMRCLERCLEGKQ